MGDENQEIHMSGIFAQIPCDIYPWVLLTGLQIRGLDNFLFGQRRATLITNEKSIRAGSGQIQTHAEILTTRRNEIMQASVHRGDKDSSTHTISSSSAPWGHSFAFPTIPIPTNLFQGLFQRVLINNSSIVQAFQQLLNTDTHLLRELLQTPHPFNHPHILDLCLPVTTQPQLPQ
jgi:hypothetical protein